MYTNKIFKLIVRYLFIFSGFIITARPEYKNYKYDLSICAIFQNEAAYLKEWIEFHKLVGVQHFYLYNNFSTDNYMQVLEPYIKSGEVRLIDWPVHASKTSCEWVLSAYNNCLKRAKNRTKWLAYLDLDEFLFPAQQDNLISFLRKYNRYGGVCANWAVFGTSAVDKIPVDKLSIECLLIRAEDAKIENTHVKSIVQPKLVKRMISPHCAEYIPNYYQVNAKKEHFAGPLSPCADFSLIRINHYWTRDENYFNNYKIERRQKDSNETSERTIELKERLNDVKDTTILRFVPKLRKQIFAH